MSWLRGHNGIVRVASDFVLLSVVTSLALNTTMQLRSRNERNRDFVIQRQLILRVLEQLQNNRRQTLLNTSSICKQMILAGLKPSEFGFDSAEASDIESTLIYLGMKHFFLKSRQRGRKWSLTTSEIHNGNKVWFIRAP